MNKNHMAREHIRPYFQHDEEAMDALDMAPGDTALYLHRLYEMWRHDDDKGRAQVMHDLKVSKILLHHLNSEDRSLLFIKFCEHLGHKMPLTCLALLMDGLALCSKSHAYTAATYKAFIAFRDDIPYRTNLPNEVQMLFALGRPDTPGGIISNLPAYFIARDLFADSYADDRYSRLREGLEVATDKFLSTLDMLLPKLIKQAALIKAQTVNGVAHSAQYMSRFIADPLMSMLADRAHEAMIYAPSAECMFREMDGLLTTLQDADEEPRLRALNSLIYDKAVMVNLILKSLTGSVERLSACMRLPDLSAPLQFGESQGSHPIESTLKKLNNVLVDAEYAPELRRDAYTKLLACLANVFATAGGPAPRKLSATQRTQIFNQLLPFVDLPRALEYTDRKGQEMLCDYVMTAHRHLADQVPLNQRGRYLEGALGL